MSAGFARRPRAAVLPCQVVLGHEADFDGFRDAARALLATGVEPAAVEWTVAGRAGGDLFATDRAAFAPAAAPARGPAVPAAFIALCRDLVQHADPARFALLYRLLWRLTREPALRDDPLDPDRLRARRMAQAVRREQHRMRAFVRFRAFAAEDGTPWQAAWHEPAHHVVDAVAPFFAARFANLRWCLLTPLRSARWDGERLVFGPGARREAAPPADAGEALWLTYYASIFDPARANPRLLDHHLPARYRPNLPEAALIPALAAGAAQRTGAMLAREPRPTPRRLPAAAGRSGPVAPPSGRELAAAADAPGGGPDRDEPVPAPFGHGASSAPAGPAAPDGPAAA